jgi:hypothetical protein
VRLTGSLELISHDTKAELVRCFLDIAVTLARAKQHCAPYLAALGLLLNRTPLHAGPEIVVSTNGNSGNQPQPFASIGTPEGRYRWGPRGDEGLSPEPAQWRIIFPGPGGTFDKIGSRGSS